MMPSVKAVSSAPTWTVPEMTGSPVAGWFGGRLSRRVGAVGSGGTVGAPRDPSTLWPLCWPFSGWVRSMSICCEAVRMTLVVRGERFCDGWWSSMIEGGHVRRLLERLAEIESAGLAGNA